MAKVKYTKIQCNMNDTLKANYMGEKLPKYLLTQNIYLELKITFFPSSYMFFHFLIHPTHYLNMCIFWTEVISCRPV